MQPGEQFLISRYAASELAGALLLGKAARKTKSAYLRSKYTWHCAEEARHAWLWMELLGDTGIAPREVHDDSGDQYFRFVDQAENDIAFLAFVHVYELRVPFHFGMHLKKSNISEPLRKLLHQLQMEEGAHLSWIADYLEAEQKKGNADVAKFVALFGEIEERTYRADMKRLQMAGGDFKELGDIIEQNLSSYDHPWKRFLTPTHAAEPASVR